MAIYEPFKVFWFSLSCHSSFRFLHKHRSPPELFKHIVVSLVYWDKARVGRQASEQNDYHTIFVLFPHEKRKIAFFFLKWEKYVWYAIYSILKWAIANRVHSTEYWREKIFHASDHVYCVCVNLIQFFSLVKENLSVIRISSIVDGLASYTRYLSCLILLFLLYTINETRKALNGSINDERNKSMWRIQHNLQFQSKTRNLLPFAGEQTAVILCHITFSRKKCSVGNSILFS